ncbi:MAG: phosphatidylserine decarboxylase [Pseudomonadota bacterium]
MPGNRYPFIAREAWPYLFAGAVLAIISQLLFGIFVFALCLLIVGLLTYLFRDPYRDIPPSPLAVLSPVYGVVTLVEEADEVFLKSRAIRIQIETRVSDPFSLRSPIEGKLLQHWCSSPDAKESRRHFDFHIQSDEGDNVVTAIRLRDIIPKFHVYLHAGERVGHGQRCGYIFFGGRTDIFLPLECKVQVETGDYVQSGSTILAQIIHSQAASVVKDKVE